MEYKIVMDSAGDLKALDGIAFECVPLKILAGTAEYVDDRNLDVEDMVKSLRHFHGRSSTACPGVGEYLEAFGDAENVFCITITSALSGSYNAAKIAAATYEEEHPDRHVHVVDSLSAGPEMRLLALKIRDLIQEGKNFTEIAELVENYKKTTHTLFTLESIHNLANNGRVNGAVAKIVGVLGIRLVGKGSEEGKLELMDKTRGERRALADIIKHMREMNYHGGKVLIDHVDNEAGAEKLKGLICEEFAHAEVQIGTCAGICSFYAEHGGMILGFEC